MQSSSFFRSIALVALTALSTTLSHGARQTEQPVPDFTKGDKIGERHDWNLGPTGARGWMWGWKFQSTKARQIYVTKVDANSPADGVLKIGDVILGVGNKPFDQDARIAFGNAITAAEADGGKLTLIRWRKGITEHVTIQLPALGGYADSAPFDCTKSAKILDAGCKHIAAELTNKLPSLKEKRWQGRNGDTSYSQPEITGAVDALALLASGKQEYAQLVEQYALAFAPEGLKLAMSSNAGMASWGWGYINIFLCEYHLATGDKRVLPAIRTYATATAQGQSFIGSWGHTMAFPSFNQGKLHGSLGGYGALNSAGLMCHLSLVLAEKCGVSNSEIKQAITKANQFFGFYTGKGAIPYGDHFPNWDSHDDNGKNSMAAVLFDLQGMTRESRFFSTMTVASYGERENGHTGNYFSFLWGPLGAQRAGSDATAAFLKPQRWFYDLNRTWQGSFPYQGKADAGKGENSYSGWDSTGSFMLTYALPLKKLYITGKGTNENNLLTGTRLKQVVADGEGYTIWDKGITHYEKKTSAELLQDLKSWSPPVRFRAAKAIGKKPEKEQLVAQLIEMLDSDVLYTRYGACQGLGALGEDAAVAVPVLQKMLQEKDMWLRVQAASALTDIGKAAAPAIPELLKLATTTDSSDPLQITQRYIAFGLFDSRGAYGRPGLLSKSLKDIDRETLYKAVKQILSNPDGRTRGTLGSVFNTLTYDELKPVMPAILEAIEKPSPSGVMFSSQIRISGIQMLAKHRVREGMALCIQIMEINKWGKNRRIAECLKVLGTYGGAAKPVLPQLRKLEKDLLAHPEARMLKANIEKVRKLIKKIENATDSIELRSLELGAEEPPNSKLQIINASSEKIEVFWLDDKGKEVSNGSAKPGNDLVITTTVGHEFIIVGLESKTRTKVKSTSHVQGFRYGPDEKDAIPSFYSQRVFTKGFPIVASATVNPYALKEAAYLIDQMLAKRDDIRKAMVLSGARFCIIAYNEYTTDLPEFIRFGEGKSRYPGVSAKDYWDARARGTGGSVTDPYCTCGEENLLGYPGDPYTKENILIHEFAHNIHLRGMNNVDPTFDVRLQQTYEKAIAKGLWKNKYAATNRFEYFAEGVQSWFGNNRENDHDHNHVNTRAELIAYDPALAALCREVFKDTQLVYTKPATRLTGHMKGYDPNKAPTFTWPARLNKAKAAIRKANKDADKPHQ